MPDTDDHISQSILANLRTGNTADEADHSRRWAAHVDAGRIGRKPQIPAAELENLKRTEAIFRSGAPYRALLERGRHIE